MEMLEIIEEMAGEYSKLLGNQELEVEFKKMVSDVGKAMTIRELRPIFQERLRERLGI